MHRYRYSTHWYPPTCLPLQVLSKNDAGSAVEIRLSPNIPGVGNAMYVWMLVSWRSPVSASKEVYKRVPFAEHCAALRLRTVEAGIEVVQLGQGLTEERFFGSADKAAVFCTHARTNAQLVGCGAWLEGLPYIFCYIRGGKASTAPVRRNAVGRYTHG